MDCNQLLEGVKSRYVSRSQNFFDLFLGDSDVLDKERIVGNMITFLLHPHLLIGEEEYLSLLSQLIEQLGLAQNGLRKIELRCDASANSLKSFVQTFKDKGLPENIFIDLASANLRAEGAKYIGDLIAATGLSRNAIIIFSYNSIGDEGVKYIAEGIRIGGLAEGCKIFLEGNGISDEGAQYLLDAINERGLPKNAKGMLSDNPISHELMSQFNTLNYGYREDIG